MVDTKHHDRVWEAVTLNLIILDNQGLTLYSLHRNFRFLCYIKHNKLCLKGVTPIQLLLYNNVHFLLENGRIKLKLGYRFIYYLNI